MLPQGASLPPTLVHIRIIGMTAWHESVVSGKINEEQVVEVCKRMFILPGEPYWIRITTLDGRLRYFCDRVEILIEDVPKEFLE